MELTFSLPTDAPAANELEVSVFGPGRGECIVVHLGKGRWGVVDSCKNRGSGRPIALEYFDSIGVDVANEVRFVLATHWHDDHIGGLAEIVEAAASAEFHCSMALQADEFLQLVDLYDESSRMSHSGVLEFAAILRSLQRRRVKGQKFVSPQWAIANRPVWEESDARVVALSPSDADVSACQRAIASLLPNPGDFRRRVGSPGRNDGSVVLSVRVLNRTVLLGADLESLADPTRGWNAVVAGGFMSDGTLVKIPHHGSVTSHHDGMWAEMLVDRPKAVITPFRNGRHSLPTEADVTRIGSLVEEAYISSIASPKRTKRSSAVEKTIDNVVVSIAEIDPPLGHVRGRATIGGEESWDIDCYGEAVQV